MTEVAVLACVGVLVVLDVPGRAIDRCVAPAAGHRGAEGNA
ncbi:hypothetical protein FB388_4172 [Pseudonocardia cypriaca]|uniref:Uncharacterized protein n=1 Tax=Pseudonocardia cypriaca TaxID=882449 RepID=A0A543FT20_9PSEU|nr:hypothetical protein FB388_4172 [Pseudonocardia cypriaca]